MGLFGNNVPGSVCFPGIWIVYIRYVLVLLGLAGREKKVPIELGTCPLAGSQFWSPASIIKIEKLLDNVFSVVFNHVWKKYHFFKALWLNYDVYLTCTIMARVIKGLISGASWETTLIRLWETLKLLNSATIGDYRRHWIHWIRYISFWEKLGSMFRLDLLGDIENLNNY